jgi:TolB protein
MRQRVNYKSERIGFTDGHVGPQGAFSSVSWSRDGQRMVFHRELEEVWPPLSETFSRDPQFRVVRTGIFPSYSSDGRQLMSNTAFAGLFHNSILVMNTDGTGRRVLFDDPTHSAVAPVWSPTGDRIAFGLGAPFGAAPMQVVVIGADGTGMRTLTPAGPGMFGFPSWSPDGKHVVIRSADAHSKGLAIIDSQSGTITPLTSGPWSDNFPAWSPKGDLIVFTSDRDGDFELYTIQPDGRGVKRLTRSPGNDAHAAWVIRRTVGRVR